METKFPVYCNQCVCGPDLLKVVVKDGVAIKIEPNFDAKDIHPAGGRICVKAYGLIHKLYNPYRIRSPLLRTNPNKGRDEDPGWKEISWDEAFRIITEKLISIRKKGFLDEEGYPSLAITLGSAGTAAAYMGTFPAFLAAWGGPIDFSIGSGQGTKCYHTEHLFGELWHRAFLVVPDTPRTKYVLSLGHNTNASAGVTGIYRHAEAREKGYKRVQVEPHLTVTGATSDEWIPIKPKGDAAFLYGIIYVILYELDWRKVCDIDFLKNMTNSAYLVGPNGYFIRHHDSKKPLIWDNADNKPKEYDDLSLKDPALTGVYKVSGIEVGPDNEICEYDAVGCKPSFQLLIEHMEKYTPEWASEICDVPPDRIRRIARELVENAMVGASMEIDGEKMPYRPIAIILGKTVNNGWGSYQVCWARTVIQMLFGAIDVAGSVIGTCVRINRPYYDRWSSVFPGEDGFMHQFLNPTSEEEWPSPPKMRGPYTELVPLAGNTGWSPFLGPTPLSWLFMGQSPKNWNRTTIPEVWIIYRANPIMSMWNTKYIEEIVGKFPFIAAFAYELNETCWYADLLLPDSTDLESLQLIRIGSQSYVENFWDYYGFALRQPVVEPLYNTLDMTDIATWLSHRVGILAEYNNSINNGVVLGVKLRGKGYDYSLNLDKKYSCEDIWDRVCRAATRRLTNGREEYGLEWFKKNGFFVVKYPRIRHYLYPIIRKWGLRFELPYQERLKRIGEELKRRLHGRGIYWWDKQLEEYQALPDCWDFTKLWDEAYNKDSEDEYDLWLLTTRSFQYSWTTNISNPLMADVAVNTLGFRGVSINSETARGKGIKNGDWVILESPFGKVRCKAVVREGVRPDTVVVMGQFGQWLTPIAKDLRIPSMNLLAGLDIGLIDAIGSGADIVKVKLYKAE